MDSQIIELIKTFEADSKVLLRKYDEFLVHIYTTYGRKMTFCRSAKIKDKYIKERDSILEYVVKNKKAILKQLNK